MRCNVVAAEARRITPVSQRRLALMLWNQVGLPRKEEQFEEHQQEQVWESLEGARVNTHKRRVLFTGGHRLTLAQSIGHLQNKHRDSAHDTIESAVLEWLEMNTASGNVTQEQMDAHDHAIEQWIQEYFERQALKKKTAENS